MKTSTHKIRNTPKNWQQYYLRPLVGAALLSTWMLPTWMLPALGIGTTAGTTITNTAYGSFENPANAGVAIPVQSNTVTLTISEVAGISVANQGVAEAPSGVTGAGPAQGDAVIGSSDVVYFTFRITNTGNDQTQFFIPNAPASVTNATFGAVGPLRIVGYNNGTTTTPLGIDVTTGAATGTFAGIPNGGSVPVGGYIDVRVPVKAGAALIPGTDSITVILGNTVSQAPANQNVQLVTGGAFGAAAGKDVYTQDNAGTANGDLTGSPAFEREASSSQTTPVGTANLDYGDAPDAAAGTATGDYETAPGRGPSHVVGSLFLGTGVDAETNFGQDKGPPLEDNGVTIGVSTPVSLHTQSLIAGQAYTLNVTTAGTGKISGWIDFNRDGDFLDAGEQIATDVSSTGGVQSFVVNVPFGAAAGSTYARFRYSSQTGLTSVNAAPDGEVEDYNINLIAAAPTLRLVKRVTSIAGTAITAVNNDPGDTNDDSTRWPASYLQGTFTGSTAAPGETVDYTIYFLSDGNTPVNQVKLCDLVPDNTTYVAGSLRISQGGAALTTLTDATGDDAGENFNSAAAVTAPCSGTNTDGGVRVNVPGTLLNATGPGAPTSSYGLIRFSVKID
jgi:uncharacterized repeat protein (TIGR01451 family)